MAENKSNDNLENILNMMSESHVRKLENIENKLANMNIAPDIRTSDKYKATNPFNNKPQYKQYEQQRGKNVQTQSSNPFRQYPRDFRGGGKEIIEGK